MKNRYPYGRSQHFKLLYILREVRYFNTALKRVDEMCASLGISQSLKALFIFTC